MADIKDKKDVSVLIETQLPEFISAKHPKFQKFIEKYYEFMESHQLYFGTTFRFHDDKLQAEDQTGENYLAYEDGTRLQLESDRDTEKNANLQFTLGETLTGNTSLATAIVTGTKGNTIAFIKPTNESTFTYAEKVTGSISRAYATLANGIIDGTFPKGSIESYRSRAPGAAIRDLLPLQDINTTCEGLIDTAWKKEFYTNIPKTTKTDRRQLLKQMSGAYRAKGNEASFGWLFRTIFAKEDIEFYYPKTDLMKTSDGRWTLDKTIKVVTSGANNLSLFTGRKITGSVSRCTAIVEQQITSFAGALQITELTLSDVVQGVVDGGLFFFKVNENIISETDVDGFYAEATTTGIVDAIAVNRGGTNYIIGDEIHITGGGGQGARARVASIADAVVEGITIVDSGDGFVEGDPLVFINEGTGGAGAAGAVGEIIKTGEIIKNSDKMSSHFAMDIANTNYGGTFTGHDKNSIMFGNSSLIFSAVLKSGSAKYYGVAGNYDATAHILPGDRIAQQLSVNTSGLTITQAVKTVTLSSAISDDERYNLVGGKLTYANGDDNIITGYSSLAGAGGFMVRDSHDFGTGQTFDIVYASNTRWGTIISANTIAILYSVGSYYRDSDLGLFSANNFINDDNIIVYDTKFTKLGTAADVSGIDAHMMHNGVTLQAGNTPAAVTTNTFTIVDAHGALPDVIADCNGAFSTETVNTGAISTFTITSGGAGYETSPPVSVANSYTPILVNALDVMGPPNSLLNLNLHSYSTGTISQDGNTVTLSSEGTFPDANSGVITLIYANGITDQITAITNSSSIRVQNEKIFGIVGADSEDVETYSLTYMANANNFGKNTLLYNDDYSARAKVLDFIDKSSSVLANPYIASGNTTLRVYMTTAQDFGSTVEHILLESKDADYNHEKLLLEHITLGEGPHSGLGNAQGGGGFFLTEECVEFLTQENGTGDALPGDAILAEDGTTNTPNSSTEGRIYTEVTTGDRITAYNVTTAAYTTGTITQSGTTVTGVGTIFPNDFVRGTITYSGDDDATSTITAYTNATSFTVEDSKTVASGNTYSISYNPAETWGINRNITMSAGGTGNRTVTVTETGHYLRTGDKVKISGSTTGIFNGIYALTVVDANTYTYTLPENTAVTSPVGSIRAMPVASAWLATSNAVTLDTSIKGNNAVIEVSAIAIGAIQSIEVYDFGAGYSTAPVLSTTSGDQNAILTGTLGAYAVYPGYYTATAGLLSSVPKIQDNKYYQAFSYVLKTDFDVSQYRSSVKRLTHPSGLIMFGELAIRSQVSVGMFDAGASGNVDSKFPVVGEDARRYHNITLYGNTSIANTRIVSYGANNELEIFTASHPWQAMDARLEHSDSVNLLMEDFRDIQSIARSNSTVLTVTEIKHGMLAGDTILITKDVTELYNGRYTIQTVPTTNTYTLTPLWGDPGLDATSSGDLFILLEDQATGNNILMDDGRTGYGSTSLLGSILNESSVDYLKVSTIAFANVFLASATNWEHPFNGAILDENDQTILLEHGGSYLYPKIQFPEGETGVTTIDVSFNSDILLEDDNGTYGWGYLLDQDSGQMGTGPQRFISLEEDTQGPDHQYESIPIVDTHVMATLYNSMRQHLISEDGLERFIYEDEELIALDTIEVFDDASFTTIPSQTIIAFHRLITEDGEYITNEEKFVAHTYFTLEDEYAIRENNLTEVQFDLLGDIQIESATSTPEVEFDLYDTTGWHFLAEDGFTHLRYEDGTRPVTEESLVKTLAPIIQTTFTAGTGQHIGMEDGYHYLYEDASIPLMEEGWFKYSVGEVEFTFSARTSGQHIIMEDGYHYLHEDESFLYLEQPPVTKTAVIVHELPESTDWHILAEDGYTHLRYEDGTRLLTEESHVKDTFGEVEFNLYDTFGWHILAEDGYTHLRYEDGTRALIEESHVKDPFGEVEFDLLNSIRGGFQTEDSLDYIVAEDADPGEGVQASKFIFEQPPVTKTAVIVHDPLISPSGRLIMEDTQATLLAFENSTSYHKSYILEEGKFEHKMVIGDVDTGTKLFNLDETTGWHLLMEDGVEHLTYEDETRALTEEGLVKTTIGFPGELEYNLIDSPGQHILMENEDHASYEDGTRLVIDDLEVETSITKHYVTEDAPSDILKWTIKNHANSSIETYSQTKIVTATYGMQPFRPHFVQNWSTAGINFSDDKIQLEDDSGVVLKEHPVANTFHILLQDYPTVEEDVLNVNKIEFDWILLEQQSEGQFLQQESYPDGASSTRLLLLETSKTPSEGYGPDATIHQSWTVLPAYQYSHILTRLKGTINFDDGGVIGTGSGSLFTTQLKVGEEFQTADENIITEDSGGGMIYDTDERIQHEDVTIADIQNVALDAEILGITIQDFRWLMSNEDADLAAHGSHPGVIGAYSPWNTDNESYWFVTAESNANFRIGQEDDGGIIERETPAWENNYMRWEDLSKQLITDPQAFIVGAISNDTSLNVTRKHLGGVSDSVYQL